MSESGLGPSYHVTGILEYVTRILVGTGNLGADFLIKFLATNSRLAENFILQPINLKKLLIAWVLVMEKSKAILFFVTPLIS